MKTTTMKTEITPEDLVDVKYVLDSFIYWIENNQEVPSAENLTYMLWENEEATNEYDLEEWEYLEIVSPFVEKTLAEQK